MAPFYLSVHNCLDKLCLLMPINSSAQPVSQEVCDFGPPVLLPLGCLLGQLSS